jgi:ethanolamine utilization protein EutA
LSEIKKIDSVGIDIGTTTLQLIFSALELVNRAPATQVPRYEFSERRILYESAIHMTPLHEDGSIDEDQLFALLQSEYTRAGKSLNEIETGAIIITGESSKASNARLSIMNLADRLGDFVVATAGPHLESVIAGRGSGAADFSDSRSARVLNIDIGGGTSNYVLFDNGRVIDTACLNVGGHLIETDQAGRVTRVREPAAKVLRLLFPGSIPQPGALTRSDLERVAQHMADLVVDLIEGLSSPLLEELMMTPPLKEIGKLDALFISGGVGECFYHPQLTQGDPFHFRDLGPILADALRAHPRLQAYPVRLPKQTIRATVIGAGAYSLSLSGSTIWVAYDKLPLRNIPVLHPAIDWQQPEPEIYGEILLAARRHDLDPGSDLYAIALSAAMPVTYRAVVQCASALARLYTEHPNPAHPTIVISANDVGKVLGMELEPRIKPKALAVIDEVNTREGDYIDIGKSYFGGEIVPLTVKSLAFPS